MQNIKVQVEDITPVKKKLDISVPAETVSREFKAAYQNIRSTASIAGFRKGAAPMNILKARFAGHVQEDVTKRIIESSYSMALSEKQFMPVEAPQIDLKGGELAEDKEFTFSVTVEIQPNVAVDGYRGMELNKESSAVTEEDIEKGVQNLKEAAAQYKEVDRPANEGDLVMVDFEAFMNGEPVKNGKGEGYPCVIGEKSLLPGFDEALKGVSKGDQKEVDITFPENYSEASLAGKVSQFKLNVKAVKEKGVPEVNEDFAKEMGCENLEALRAKVKEEIEKHKSSEAKERLKNEILDKLIASHPFDVPDALVNRYMGVILNRVIENMRSGMAAPEDRGLNIDQLKEKYRPAAARSVKEDIILDTIAAKEAVQVSLVEVEASVRGIAAQRGVSYESLMSRIQTEGAMEVIKDGLKHEKVFDIIIEASK
ncbi:MAG: trigger factor [Deltaproteobacteria bacterium GWA2_54_12]|nr:MAG: trigger factor [Deltaproteobacteria bacterium GWA2_54_12]